MVKRVGEQRQWADTGAGFIISRADLLYQHMTSRRRLFIAALIAGGMFRLGIPGIADLVSYAWARAEPVSRSLLPGQEGLIALAGIGVLALVGYLNYDIFFKGAKKGKRGLLLVIYGFLAGFFLASAGIAMAGLA